MATLHNEIKPEKDKINLQHLVKTRNADTKHQEEGGWKEKGKKIYYCPRRTYTRRILHCNTTLSLSLLIHQRGML
jgi:hypothetical protein